MLNYVNSKIDTIYITQYIYILYIIMKILYIMRKS